MKTKLKREARAKLVAQAREITDAVKDGENMTAEQETKFDAIMADADKLKKEIDRLEALDDAETDLNGRVSNRAGRERISEDEAKTKIAFEASTFKHYMRAGVGGMDDEMKAVALPRIKAALGTGTDSAGGYLVPAGFYGQLIEAQLSFGGMLAVDANGHPVCYTFDTESGNPLPIPTDNDTANEGAILGENTQSPEQDVTFGAVTINGHTYTSKIVRVANQLLNDSAFDIGGFLSKALGTRLARAQNRHFTTGDGASKPTGVVTAAALGFSAAGAAAILPDELLDLEHSVDPAYRGNARYMMADGTLKVIKKLKDSQNRYLWMSGLAFKEPDSINGYPYTINQHMAAVATTNKSLLFGDFQKYFIRRIGGVMLMRLVERYADYNQTGFVAFQRTDGNLVDAGTHPIKYLQQA